MSERVSLYISLSSESGLEVSFRGSKAYELKTHFCYFLLVKVFAKDIRLIFQVLCERDKYSKKCRILLI